MKVDHRRGSGVSVRCEESAVVSARPTVARIRWFFDKLAYFCRIAEVHFHYVRVFVGMFIFLGNEWASNVVRSKCFITFSYVFSMRYCRLYQEVESLLLL